MPTSAFVPGAPAALRASSFTPRACRAAAAPPAAPTRTAVTTARVLDGLDTDTQQAYTFSRTILGPFFGKTLAPARDGSLGAEGERQVALAAVYRHVFGNAYIMEEERAELAVAESQFKLGAMTMREFVRALGKSSAYKTRFFEGASMYRFTEVNYMHFLGRAPDDHKEIAAAMAVYHSKGVDACIDALVDSEEYSSVFGEDTIPFLRFRGFYAPCGSFGMQLALKGGWANSDKAMGGAALSGYNGSDGRQMSEYITAHVLPNEAQAPYEALAENTPLKTTSPNWYSLPDPALEPTPAFVSPTEVAALQKNLASLQMQYDAAIQKRNSPDGEDQLEMFREMTRDMAPMLDRGFAFSGGEALNLNPYARDMLDTASPLTEGGCKPSDFMRYGGNMESNTISRLERDLEQVKGKLRVYEKALSNSQPMDQSVNLPGAESSVVQEATLAEKASNNRPRINLSKLAQTTAAAAAAAAGSKPEQMDTKKQGPVLAGVQLPSLPNISLPSLPDISLPSLPNPFAKKN